jgi:hypothetical protein
MEQSIQSWRGGMRSKETSVPHCSERAEQSLASLGSVNMGVRRATRATRK